MQAVDPRIWKKCNECKKPILYASKYYVCSVSTCNKRPYDFHFCSVSCWGPHVGILRHRDSYAIEEKAPTFEAYQRELAELQNPKPRERQVKPKESQVSSSLQPSPQIIRRRVDGSESVISARSTQDASTPASTAFAAKASEVKEVSKAMMPTELSRSKDLNKGVSQVSEENQEILVVVSKLKNYIREKSEMNTSAEVMEHLSKKLRQLCDQAIIKARQDGRKTVMARDFV